jgi:hypothetical protein
MQLNAFAARDLVADFASSNGFAFIDPSPSMLEAVNVGQAPFMSYDSHWSALGHQLVANTVAEALATGACP